MSDLSPPRTTRRARAQARRALRRQRRSRLLRVCVIGLGVAALTLPAPAMAPSIACGPIPTGAAVVSFGQLADDGELTSLRRRVVGDDGQVCDEEVDDGDLDVEVAILHRDVDGRSLEASQLRAGRPVRTRVSVRDTTAQAQELAVAGPVGSVNQQRRVGIPQLVRATVRYPSGWDVTPPEGDGVGSRIDGEVVEVTRTAVLFAPLLDEELVLEVEARPGRGTPSVTVDATPLTAATAQAVPDGLLDRDTTAVVAALLELAEAGARELTEGAEQLAAGGDRLADGAAEVADGSAGLGEGMAGLADGVGEVSAGIGASAAGARELAGGADRLADGTAQVAAGAGPLADGATELATGARMLSDELSFLREVEPPDVDPDEVVTGVAEISAGIREVRDQLQAMLPPDPDPQDPLVIAIGVLTEMADGLDEAAAGIAEALGAVVDAAEGVRELAEGVDALASGAEELAAGIDELEGALHGLADGAAALASGANELAAGLGELSAASDELASGADELTVGARGLAAGTDGVAEGARGLADGMEELADGAGQLPDALGDAMGIADRGGERAAITAAVLDQGAMRAEARRGDADLVTTQLVHRGNDPLPLLPVGIGGLLLALGAGATTWWMKRKGAA